MNAIAERWIGDAGASSWTAASSGTRLICGGSCASTRPSQSAPAAPLPGRGRAAETATRAVDLGQYRVRKRARVGGLINEYRLVA